MACKPGLRRRDRLLQNPGMWRRFVGWVLLVLLGASRTAAPAGAPEIPYRRFAPVIDGDLREWRPPWYAGEIIETAAQPPQANRVRVRLCWDLDGLLLAGEVDDQELIRAPAELLVDQYHQYDSLQVYIDARADASARMNDDDVDLLLLPDGRHGTLRGDAMVAALAGANVPQRASAPLHVDYATRLTRTGWQFELRIPFAGLGIQPVAGLPLGIDVAGNDWLVDHPPGASEGLTPERVRELEDRSALIDTADPAVGTQLLPRSWSGANDFGYPQQWRRLELSGEPIGWEALERRIGLRAALLAVSLAGLALGLGCAAAVYIWHRRQLRRLLARMAALSELVPAALPAAASASDAGTSAVAEEASTVVDDATASNLRDREFAEQVLAHIRAHLAQPLTPGELADQFHVSLRTLQRRLKSGLSTSPQDLVLAARLEAARELLRSGRHRVSEVALKVGFEDLSHFSRRYRQAYGHAPSAEAAV